MNPEILIDFDKQLGFYLSVKSKHKIKFFLWSYSTIEIAQHVKDHLIERWEDCFVQMFEDYTLSFKDRLSDIQSTPITINEMSSSWVNTEKHKVELQKVSGYNHGTRQS